MKYTLLLKDIRKSRGMTQAELGEKIGTTARVVGSWERMETPIQMDDACKCANALSCTPNDLIGWSSETVLSMAEHELIDNYRKCDKPTRASILMVAKNGALASVSQAECASKLDRSEIA